MDGPGGGQLKDCLFMQQRLYFSPLPHGHGAPNASFPM